jgi:hypothetical protein
MDPRGEDGIALLVALMAMLLMTALGAAVLLTTASETMIAASFRASTDALYAADAALERAIDGLPAAPDWSVLLGGLTPSTFADGAPGGVRTLPDGSPLDLDQVVNLANCQKTAPCSSADMDTVTADRPWGRRNPRWVLYGYGPLADVLAGGTVNSACYVVVLIGAPVDPASSASGTLAIRAESFGPRSAHKVVESTVERADTGVRMLSWRTVR